jgi:flagellar biosynthetic protein FliR
MDAAGTQFQQLIDDVGAIAYLPALARVGAVLAVVPPFAAMAVPRRVRALVAIALTIGLMPAVSAQAQPNPSLAELSLGIAGEVLIGLAMGMSLALVFTAAQWGGELITQQMGLSLSEIYDPRTGGAVGSLGHLYWLLAVVVFLGANGHHALLRGVAGSFQAIPVMSVSAGAPIVSLMVGLLQSATGLAIQLAAPVFVSMLVVDLALGMMFRTMPQLGVMTAGLTVRSVTGLVVMIVGLALTAGVVQGAGLNWMRIVTTSFNSLGNAVGGR